MLWLKVSAGSSRCAYSCTALERAEEGRGMEETETAGAFPETWNCSRRAEVFRGTAVQPYFSIAGLLMVAMVGLDRCWTGLSSGD